MQYLLEATHQFIYQSLPNFLINPDSGSVETLIESHLAKLRQFSDSLLQTVFKCGSEKKKQVVIRSVQSAITILSDELLRHEMLIEGRQLSDVTKCWQLAIIRQFNEQFICCLEVIDQFPQYLHSSNPVPQYYRLQQIKFVRQEMAHLASACRLEAVTKLLNLITRVLSDFIDSNPLFNWRQAQYIRELVRRLTRFEPTGSPAYEDEMIQLLVAMNFNHDAFITHAYSRIIQQPGDGEDADALLYRLESTCCRLQRIPTENVDGLYPSHISCVNALVANLKLEISRMEKERAAIAAEPAVALVANSLDIRTTLSVAQLGLLLHLLQQSGLLTCKPLDRFFKLIAANISTESGARYTAGSIQTRYYTHDLAAKDAVKSHLISLVNELRQL